MYSIKPMQNSLRMYSKVSGTHEFLENLAATNWSNYASMYVHVLDKKKKDPEKIRNRDRSSDMDAGFGVHMHFNIEEVLKVAMRCLHAQIEHVNLYKIAVPVANWMHFPVQQISINKSVTVSWGFHNLIIHLSRSFLDWFHAGYIDPQLSWVMSCTFQQFIQQSLG